MEGQPIKQNLIKQIPAERIPRPAGFYKLIVLDVLTVGGALGFGYLYKLYLGDKTTLTILTIGLGLFACLSALQVLLMKNFGRRFFVLALETILMLGFFYDSPANILLSAALCLIGFFSLGEIMSRREASNSLEMKFFRVMKPFFTKFMTGMVLALILLYIPQWNPENIFISEAAFNGFFGQTIKLVHSFYPEINFTSSIGDMAQDVARVSLRDQKEFIGLTPGIQSQVVTRTAEELITSWSSKVGMVIKETQSTSNVFYNLAVEGLNNLYKKFGGGLLTAWAIVAFLIIRGFGALFYWAVAGITFIVYQIFLVLDVVRIIGESRTHEVLEFS